MTIGKHELKWNKNNAVDTATSNPEKCFGITYIVEENMY